MADAKIKIRLSFEKQKKTPPKENYLKKEKEKEKKFFLKRENK